MSITFRGDYSGPLSSIADNGKVFSVVDKIRDFNTLEGDRKFELLLKGIKKEASIFPGFCGVHDDMFFKPIEKQRVDFNEFHAFLFSYRALGYELQRREKLIESRNIDRELDAGFDFESQVRHQESINSIIVQDTLILDFLNEWKKTLDRRYFQNQQSESYFLVEFEELLPFVTCGAFMPLVDFNGNRYLQLSTEFISINVVSYNKKSKAIITYFGGKRGAAEKFVDSLASLSKYALANAIFHLTLEQLENIYIRPVWWRSIDQTLKEKLIKRMLTGVDLKSLGEQINARDTYMDLEPILSTKLPPKTKRFCISDFT